MEADVAERLNALEQRISALEAEQTKLIQMTVTNEKGKTPKELIGEICLKDTFVFYASSDAGVSVNDVKIVMPLGGNETGLFRYPQVGEKVMVNKITDGYYLLGFVPNNIKTDENYFANPAVGEKPQVFRYKNTGDNYTKRGYSEIGFYTRQETDEGETFSRDEIGLTSTGDIKNYASDSYRINADSFNLGIGGNENSNASIEIDTNGKITINASDSIEFNVGRTSLSISDSEFSVKSKLGDSILDNSWDASLSLKAMKGFSASGLNCELEAIRGSSIGDSMGGKFSTSSGVGKIDGREIKLNTMSKFEYNLLALFSTYDFIFNTIAFTDARNHYIKDGGAYVFSWIALVKDVIGDVHEIVGDVLELREKIAKEKEALQKQAAAQLLAQQQAAAQPAAQAAAGQQGQPPAQGTGTAPAAPPAQGGGAVPAAQPAQGSGTAPAAPPAQGGGSVPASQAAQGGGAVPASQPAQGGGGTPASQPAQGGGTAPATQPAQSGGAVPASQPAQGGGGAPATQPAQSGGAAPASQPAQSGGGAPTPPAAPATPPKPTK